MKNFDLLKDKTYYLIIDGDTTFYNIGDKKYGLPYLSGYDLIGVCKLFGVNNIPMRGSSRWCYVEAILNEIDSTKRYQEFFGWLFNKSRFKFLTTIEEIDINVTYNQIIERAFDEINKYLFLNNKQLICKNGIYDIIDINNVNDNILAEKKIIDIYYINSLLERCKKNFENNEYDEIVTKSRTLVEEVLIYVLEKENIAFDKNGDIAKYYKDIKNVLKFNIDKKLDERIKKLLGSLETIVNSIAEFRNNYSDAHGVGANRIIVNQNEAKLVMNSAIVLCNYIIEVYDK